MVQARLGLLKNMQIYAPAFGGGAGHGCAPASNRSGGEDWEVTSKSEVETNKTSTRPSEMIFCHVERLHKASEREERADSTDLPPILSQGHLGSNV